MLGGGWLYNRGWNSPISNFSTCECWCLSIHLKGSFELAALRVLFYCTFVCWLDYRVSRFLVFRIECGLCHVWSVIYTYWIFIISDLVPISLFICFLRILRVCELVYHCNWSFRCRLVLHIRFGYDLVKQILNVDCLPTIDNLCLNKSRDQVVRIDWEGIIRT